MKSMKEWSKQEIRWYYELCLDSSLADMQEGYPEPPVITEKEHIKNLITLLNHETNEFKKELLKEWVNKKRSEIK